MKYASLFANANNIGEEIQIIAAQRFYPNVDIYLNKECLNSYNLSNQYKIILNCWYGRHPKNFYLCKNVIPLITSLHITPDIEKEFFNKNVINFLQKNSPVGCRDIFTLEMMKKHDIPAYFSGCLTLTLQKNEKIQKRDYVLAVDCSQEVVEKIKKDTGYKVYELSSLWHFYYTFEERMHLAKIFLKKMQQARAVITRRLHAALPSTALGTSVLLINDKNYFTCNERFSGFEKIVNMCTEEEFLNNKYIFDYDSPLVTDTYLNIRQELIKTCKNFTGFDSQKSPILATTDEEDNFEIMKYLHMEDKLHIEKFCYVIPPKVMIKNILKRSFLKFNDDNWKSPQNPHRCRESNPANGL